MKSKNIYCPKCGQLLFVSIGDKLLIGNMLLECMDGLCSNCGTGFSNVNYGNGMEWDWYEIISEDENGKIIRSI